MPGNSYMYKQQQRVQRALEREERRQQREAEREERRREKQARRAAGQVAGKIAELVTGTPDSTIAEQASHKWQDYSEVRRQGEHQERGNSARDAANDRADRGKWTSSQ